MSRNLSGVPTRRPDRDETPPETARARTGRSWKIVALAATVAVLGAGGWAVWDAVPDAETRAKTSVNVPEGVGFTQRLDATVPGDVTLFDEQGNPVQLADRFGGSKPVILNLVYFECPMLCNMSMDALIRTLNTMQLRVGRDFDVVTISFDPREGPQLAAAARKTTLTRYGDPDSAAGWHFLTGDERAIAAVTDAVGFNYRYDEASGQYAHAAGVILLTPEGRISRYLTGIDYAARDLRLGLVEATEGRIGTSTDQVLLLCFRYDPLTGKYGLAVSRAIQVAGVATFLGLIGGVGLLLHREGRPAAAREDAEPTSGSTPPP